MKTKATFFFGLILFLVSFVTGAYRCGHQPPDVNKVLYDVVLDTSSNAGRIDIEVYIFHSLTNLLFVNRVVYDEYVEDINAAVEQLEKFLIVKRKVNVLALYRHCRENQRVSISGNEHSHCAINCETYTRCGEAVVPDIFLGPCRRATFNNESFVFNPDRGGTGRGITGADYALMVTYGASEQCSRSREVLFAHSTHCQQESLLDRPIAGNLHICPFKSESHLYDSPDRQSMILHELIHLMGFSPAHYAFYRDPAGQPYSQRDFTTKRPQFNPDTRIYMWNNRIIRNVMQFDWLLKGGSINRTTYMMVSPNVMAAAQKYFNCPALEGVELEDSDHLPMHWEQRIYPEELMKPTLSPSYYISELTLALLKDTGWYHINESNADKMPKISAGRGDCDYATSSCGDWMQSQNIDNVGFAYPFCTHFSVARNQKVVCNADRTRFLRCNIGRVPYDLTGTEQFYFDQLHGHRDLTVRYQTFSGSHVADTCPQLQDYSTFYGRKHFRGHCDKTRYQHEDDVNYALEEYGPQSACFEHSYEFKAQYCHYTLKHDYSGAGCYEYYCTEEEGLVVMVDDMNYTCRYEGEIIHIKAIKPTWQLWLKWLHSGSIICPSCAEMCEKDGINCSAIEVDRSPIVYESIDIPCCANPAAIFSFWSILFVLYALVITISQ